MRPVRVSLRVSFYGSGRWDFDPLRFSLSTSFRSSAAGLRSRHSKRSARPPDRKTDPESIRSAAVFFFLTTLFFPVSFVCVCVCVFGRTEHWWRINTDSFTQRHTHTHAHKKLGKTRYCAYAPAWRAARDQIRWDGSSVLLSFRLNNNSNNNNSNNNNNNKLGKHARRALLFEIFEFDGPEAGGPRQRAVRDSSQRYSAAEEKITTKTQIKWPAARRGSPPAPTWYHSVKPGKTR